MAFNFYLPGLKSWARFHRRAIDDQLTYAAHGTTLGEAAGTVVRGVTGDSLSRMQNEGVGFGSVIPRRALRLLAETYPTATAAAIEVYQDTTRAWLASRGVRPDHIQLRMEPVRRNPTEAAFAATEPPEQRLIESDNKMGDAGPLAPAVCVADHSGALRGKPSAPYPEGSLAAVFSYVSRVGEPIRVAYGSDNSLSIPMRYMDAPVKPVPAEVFFPEGSKTYSGQLRSRSFRVAFRPGETVSWTLLGTTVTATANTPRCSEK